MTSILQPGRNCWRLDRADRFSSIQDAADCFRLVRQALLAARDTVFILGWDTTAIVDLVPEGPTDGAPTRLDRLLRHIATRRPRLRCYILTWDYGSLYTLERDPFTRWRLGWGMPGNVRFGFDDRHPIDAPVFGVLTNQLVERRHRRHGAMHEVFGETADRGVGVGQMLGEVGLDRLARRNASNFMKIKHLQRSLACLPPDAGHRRPCPIGGPIRE